MLSAQAHQLRGAVSVLPPRDDAHHTLTLFQNLQNSNASENTSAARLCLMNDTPTHALLCASGTTLCTGIRVPTARRRARDFLIGPIHAFDAAREQFSAFRPRTWRRTNA